MEQWIAEYLEAQKRAVDSLAPAQLAGLVETLRTAHAADRQIVRGGDAASLRIDEDYPKIGVGHAAGRQEQLSDCSR